MSNKLYSNRDIRKLDKTGNYYSKHLSAITGEGLIEKPAIAAELAHRDMVIDELKSAISAAKKHGEASEDPFYKMMQLLNENS